jgi:hypothetical protein
MPDTTAAEAITPPRWADVLPRVCLLQTQSPEEAEGAVRRPQPTAVPLEGGSLGAPARGGYVPYGDWRRNVSCSPRRYLESSMRQRGDSGSRDREARGA